MAANCRHISRLKLRSCGVSRFRSKPRLAPGEEPGPRPIDLHQPWGYGVKYRRVGDQKRRRGAEDLGVANANQATVELVLGLVERQQVVLAGGEDRCVGCQRLSFPFVDGAPSASFARSACGPGVRARHVEQIFFAWR
jgi:hypothetical protein